MKDIPCFSKHFLFGSAAASYQVEGGIENNDWAQAARDGKVPVCGKACDHYNRFEEDFDLAYEMGHTIHRFSVEWARIQPEEGVFNKEAIEHYRLVIQALKKRDITPMVTCWHWTLPQWLSDKGGMSNEAFPEYFSRYCEKLVSELGSEADLWVTINEPLVVASHGYMKGTFPPFKKSFLSYIKVLSILVEAHTCAYRRMKNVNNGVRIGIAKHNIYFTSNKNPFNMLSAWVARWWWNERFLDAIRTYQDFIGLNHYHYKPFGIATSGLKTDMGWEIYPKAIYHVLKELVEYNVPIYVTESGLADAVDSRREDYIRGYLSEIARARDEDVPVVGYMYWSLLDNYEWTYGFDKRFGLIEMNYETLKRTIRPSARAYAEIIRENVKE